MSTVVQPTSPAEGVSLQVRSEPRRSTGNLITHAILIVAVIVMLFPVFWVVSTSFKTQQEIESSRVTLFPQVFTLEPVAAN